MFLQLFLKRFVQAETLTIFDNFSIRLSLRFSNFSKSLWRLLFFYMIAITNSDEILASCCDSDVGPIKGCASHLDVLHEPIWIYQPNLWQFTYGTTWYLPDSLLPARIFIQSILTLEFFFPPICYKNHIIPFLYQPVVYRSTIFPAGHWI